MAGDNDLGSLLGGLLGDKAGGSAGGVLTSLLAAFTQGQGGSPGGNPLGGLLETLAKSGLGGQAQSWVGTGSNEQLTPDQVKEALPDATLQKVAAKSGVSPDQAANDIAGALPTAVDKLTPGGRGTGPLARRAGQGAEVLTGRPETASSDVPHRARRPSRQAGAARR
ncbi:YidB family protein [Streptomyces sp. NBC_00063]|uniref:YidB family protein n=1 Tax=Streptomyces sp. NBC_00063 TaxID=2975638 RepID=UPI003D70D7E8